MFALFFSVQLFLMLLLFLLLLFLEEMLVGLARDGIDVRLTGSRLRCPGSFFSKIWVRKTFLEIGSCLKKDFLLFCFLF